MKIEYNTRYRSMTIVNTKLLLRTLIKSERSVDVMKIKMKNKREKNYDAIVPRNDLRD